MVPNPKPRRVSIVLTPDGVKRVIDAPSGTPQLIVKLLSGSGLRLMVALRLLWRWQYVFPARDLSIDPRTGLRRRYHFDEATINKAIKVAVARVGLTKRTSSLPTWLERLNQEPRCPRGYC